MLTDADKAAGHRSAPRRQGAGTLTQSEFARQFTEAFRKLWLIAVGITRNAALADDVVQEAALIGLSKLDEFEPGSNFGAWMGQTVRYIALNASRREGKRRGAALDDVDLEWMSPQTQPGAPLDPKLVAAGTLPADQAHFDDRVVAALGSVSDTARACLLLRTLEGLDYAEISTLLQIPAGTAMSHVHRARRQLRELLTEPEGTETGGASA